jgi:hypothetical protein
LNFASNFGGVGSMPLFPKPIWICHFFVFSFLKKITYPPFPSGFTFSHLIINFLCLSQGSKLRSNASSLIHSDMKPVLHMQCMCEVTVLRLRLCFLFCLMSSVDIFVLLSFHILQLGRQPWVFRP